MQCQWQRLVLGLVMAVMVKAGEQRTRSVEVKPNKPLDDVQLELRIEPAAADGSPRVAAGAETPKLRVGTRLMLCFSASRSGYITLWSWDAEENPPVRIYPNEYAVETADKRAEAIDGGQEMCIGREHDDFRLEVARPLGKADLYLHYTRNVEEQLGEDAYPEISFTRSIDERPYASRHLPYSVVE